MGRMINIFDLSAGMAGTKVLTDRAHRDGSVSGNRPYVPNKVLDPIAVQIEDKPVTYELKRSSSNKRSGGTSMKMLIAQEMSKETEIRRKPPSVVARLMGLDALPVQQPVLIPQESIPDPYKHNALRNDIHLSQLSGGTQGYAEQENGYFDTTTQCDIHPSQHHFSDKREYKDVYEVWPQQSRVKHFKEQPISKERHNENINEKKMALVRQKFMEAKCLATDQKLLQSKEFQEALEVLSSNRDLFLRFLEEPNSLFSKHLPELRTASTVPQTKRITVLKPSKSMDTRYDNEMKKHWHTVEDDQFDKNKISWLPGSVHPRAENLSQPTRIVVLKPSLRKPLDLKTAFSSPAFCTGLLDDRDIFEQLDTDETRDSRGVAKEITQQTRESLSGNRRDDTLLSSVLSNGYIGDESSFNRSENEFMEDDGGSFSDSEIITPASRCSLDNINRFESPLSLSSLSRASYSPESSVIREAKKRLSERWALVASNGTSQEQRQLRRSSSTLGEMLAIPEAKREEGIEEVLTVSSSRSCGVEQDVRLPAACLSVNRNDDGSGGAGSSRNLLRSKSVPASSLACDDIELNVEVSRSQVDKSIDSKDSFKPKSGKSSLKGKVSSLFSFRNKKPNREKSEPSPLVVTPATVQAVKSECMGNNNGEFSQCSSADVRGGMQNSEELIRVAASDNGVKQAISSVKAASPLAKVRGGENASENQEQPSPISVLEPAFEDDVNLSSSRSSEGANLESRRLVSRSPPIGSVARSLSWDECHSATSSVKFTKILSKADDIEEHYTFVKSLLSSAGLDNEKSSTALARWHSLESPLNPLLLDEFLERKVEDAKCRERRSNQLLLFDSVNAALLDISWTAAFDTSRVKVIKNGMSSRGVPVDASVTEEVWVRIKNWFHCEEKQYADHVESSSLSSLVVDRVLKNEVAGSRWMQMQSLQMDQIGKEIEGELLEELVGEALADLFPGWP